LEWNNAQTGAAYLGGTGGSQLGLGQGQYQTQADPAGSVAGGTLVYPNNLEASLNPGTINDLRQAFAIQRMMEKDARGGTRYIEKIKSHFGVTSPDARLQRPEYLGGSSIPINVTPVPQTSGTPAAPGAPDTDKTPQGNLAATGVVAAAGIGFTKSFVEHCIVIGLVSVRADLTYQQCTNRMWNRKTIYDFYWPSLAHLGEQAVLNSEIYAGGVAPNGVFGYQERWAEYRYYPSQVTGLFRSIAAGTLDFWHLAENFTVQPVLGATFISEPPPIDRVIAVPSEPQFLFDSHFVIKAARPLPTYSVPGMADHL